MSRRCLVVMVGQENIPLEGPKRILEADQRRLPIVNDLEVVYDPKKVLVPPSFIISPKRPSGVVNLRLVVEHSGYEYDGDDVIGPGFAPLCTQSWQERMDDLFVIPLSIIPELPEFFANLDE